LKHIALLILLILIVGCDDLKSVRQDDVTYVITTPNVTAEEVDILLNRLSEYKPSIFSKIEYIHNSNEIVFSNGHPTEEIITFLSTTPGKIQLMKEGSYVSWIDNTHVVNVSTSRKNDLVAFSFELSDEGKQLMLAKSRANIGQMIVIKLDNKEISRARLQDELGQFFQVTLSISAEESVKVRTLLKYGNLSRPLVLEKKSQIPNGNSVAP
jgi:preprotein translocase subunit SecD